VQPSLFALPSDNVGPLSSCLDQNVREDIVIAPRGAYGRPHMDTNNRMLRSQCDHARRVRAVASMIRPLGLQFVTEIETK
jgi:hypothetical protein